MPLPSDLDDREDRLSEEADPAANAVRSDFCAGASMGSSYVVADVEYESCADELRLCGGDETLMRPSDMRVLLTALPSPLPLSRLGVLLESDNWLFSLGSFDLRAERWRSLARGLGGRLLERWSPRGG